MEDLADELGIHLGIGVRRLHHERIWSAKNLPQAAWQQDRDTPGRGSTAALADSSQQRDIVCADDATSLPIEVVGPC